MSEPTRWRDQGPDEVRALLRDAPRTRDLTAAERARSRKRLTRATAVLAVAGAAAWLPGAALGAGLGLVVVGTAYVAPALLAPTPVEAPERAVSSLPPAAPASASPRAPLAPSAPPPPASAEAPRPSPSLSARAPEDPAAADEGAAPRRDSLAEEAALLEQARAALGPNPAQALAITDVHAAQFASGKLSLERELLAIDALRRLGRTSEGRARAEALLPRARGGLYEARVQKLLDGLR